MDGKRTRRTNGKGRGRATRQPTIGEYLIERLLALGLKDIFGIPGDFVLGFYGLLEDSPIRVIGTTNELNAGYAADAYARVRGIGAVCVTYSVGGLSLVNAVAGAYAEKSPVIVISGAPGMDERAGDPLLHHRVGAFSTQREVFEKITVAAASLEDPQSRDDAEAAGLSRGAAGLRRRAARTSPRTSHAAPPERRGGARRGARRGGCDDHRRQAAGDRDQRCTGHGRAGRRSAAAPSRRGLFDPA